MPDNAAGEKAGLHPDVLKLGIVSLLTDLSSEMIFSVFAIFFTTIAGASAALLGAIEGLADLSAASLNYYAGRLSDRTGKRKAFALAGYGFSTLAKMILLISSSVAGLGCFRLIERLGKGFRGPPRDAWLAAVANRSNRGYSFGIHKALDKSGAVLGPLVAYGLISRFGNTASTYQMLFWVAMVPAVISIGVLSRIQDRPGPKRENTGTAQTWSTLGAGFKRYLICAGTFSLAYFSFSFLLLRARDIGFAVEEVVLLYALFNVSCVASAPLIGKLSDHFGRGPMVMVGYLSYCLMCIGFGLANARWQVIVLFVLYGIFYAIDDAQSKAFIADLETERRASAIGLYNFVTGLIYLPGSLVAGALWLLHPIIAFLAGAAISLLAFLIFARLRPDRLRPLWLHAGF